MRAYFRHRRRSLLAQVRAVAAQFLFWLPILVFRSAARRGSNRRRNTPLSADNDLQFETRIGSLLSCCSSANQRKQVREILERYAALHAALEDDEFSGSGQFELFAISGNGNGTTGTPCLYRKNLSKLRTHRLRTAEDLIRLAYSIDGPTSSDLTVSQLVSFFDAFGDRASIDKLMDFRSKLQSSDEARIRMAA